MKHQSSRSATKKTTNRKQRTAKTFHDEAINFIDVNVFRLISLGNSNFDEESQQRVRSILSLLKDEIPKTNDSKSSNQGSQILWADDLLLCIKSWAKRNIKDKYARDRFLESIACQRRILANYGHSVSHSKKVEKV